ncbi:hypothetical protein ACIRG5_46895 [Lentzea sp. NPDC102401]|uniref:hypothetical protein n=1 Tax=Lentzea sp. NPDC102401 TaxID=3364128 RepID=UPI003823AF7D
MTGEQIRRRGLVQAAVGVALVAWVVVASALADVGNPQVLVGAAVTGGLVCLCAVAGGVVATRITDAASAARLRHVFVVFEGTALSLLFPFYWFGLGLEPPDGSGYFLVGFVFVIVLAIPVVAALAFVVLGSRAVHMTVVEAFGPIVPDSGAEAPAQRIRVLGTVLVTAGVVLSAGVLAVAFTAPPLWLVLELPGLLVTLTPVLLGVLLVRVRDVYAARRRNVAAYLILPGACGYAVAKAASIGGASGMLVGGLIFGAVVLLVVALLVVREFTGMWDRPWQETRRISR